MSNPKDFSNRPFVAGSLRGIRHWRTPEPHKGGQTLVTWEPLGGLRRMIKLHEALYAASRFKTWVPGENVAVCDSQFDFPGNKLLSKNCTCGFYAFFSEEWDEFAYAGDGWVPIHGIIEGYGSAVVGWKGFRAEKAKVLAFIDDQRRGIPDKIQQEYAGVPIYTDLQDALNDFPLSVAPDDLQPSPEELENHLNQQAMVKAATAVAKKIEKKYQYPRPTTNTVMLPVPGSARVLYSGDTITFQGQTIQIT